MNAVVRWSTSLRCASSLALWLAACTWLGAAPEDKKPSSPEVQGLPVRGLHLSAPSKKDVGTALEFFRSALPKEGVNTLILEFGWHYDFQSRPEFSDPSAPGKDDVRKIAQACREGGIELIPQINCLGHQSWAEHDGRLLQKHPEFDETPGKYPKNKGIYCRSYCPLHPEVHAVLFALIDELARACEAKSFHVGMDEVFILADPDCARCRGKDPAELFAGEVKTLQAHLKEIGCRMWMWGDRFIDGKATGIGKWEASENGTAAASQALAKGTRPHHVVCTMPRARPARAGSPPARRARIFSSCPSATPGFRHGHPTTGNPFPAKSRGVSWAFS